MCRVCGMIKGEAGQATSPFLQASQGFASSPGDMLRHWRTPETRSAVIQSALYRDYSTACNWVRVENRRANKRAVVKQARSDVTRWPQVTSGYILKTEPVGFLKGMTMQYYGKK